jgi:L-aminopeptidase/D-esterase-like protein
VPGAILFDLANGGDKAWGLDPPYRRLGIEAVQAAGLDIDLGTAGAGYGAMAGGWKGGTGSASFVTHDGFTIGALAAVNSYGSVTAGDNRSFWAAPFEIGAEFGGLGSAGLSAAADDWNMAKANPGLRQNTTIACVAVDAVLTPGEARRIAIMAQDGLARAIRPVHAPFDGDVVFALSTARRPLEGGDAALLVRSVATQSITTKRAKKSSEAPRSFRPTITTTENAQASAIGSRWRGSGRRSGPTFQVLAAMSSRRSAR